MRDKRGRWVLGAILLLLALGALLLGLAPGPCRTEIKILSDRALLEGLLAQMGPWAPVMIILAEIVQVLLAPIPGQVVGIVAGYLYGVLWGTLFCEVGLALGSLLAIWIARKLGRPLVEKIAGAKLLERIDGYIEKRGPWALFLIFLLPFLPDDTVCLIAGLTRIRLAELLLIATVGRLPGLVISTLIGTQTHGLTGMQLLVVAVASILLALGFFLYQRPLEQFMFRLLDRFHRG